MSETPGLVAVSMPCEPGRIIRRTEIAGPHSLNEPGQPGRHGGTPEERCAELAAIIEWLAVDDDRHLRYKARDGYTFCNIYAHDYCHLAGVYAPRVWWTREAIDTQRGGGTVEPRYAENLFEQRVNDTFHWLREFGAEFGWQPVGTLTELQSQVNDGAVGLVLGLRREPGRPGHITVVVPEIAEHHALRNEAGEVTVPLQSQAGTQSFRYDTWRPDWWKDEQFAESAFWLHP
jgi:hypothetical protein